MKGGQYMNWSGCITGLNVFESRAPWNAFFNLLWHISITTRCWFVSQLLSLLYFVTFTLLKRV
jgi:hypothetical protein